MAMAMQSGIGISKILFIAGAGYTGTVLIKNGKLSDIIGELQLLVKGLEKSGQADGEGEYADAIADQVRRLANEIRQIASNRPITVLNGGSGQSNLSSLVLPAAAVGAVGYGYMWLKGISFSDLMYVTKRNMENAVADLTKKLNHASDVLDDAKKHLTQRIQKLADKMNKQTEISRSIQNGVADVRKDITNIRNTMGILHEDFKTVDGRLARLTQNQEATNKGLDYVIKFIDGNVQIMPGSKWRTTQQELPRLPGRSPGLLPYSGPPNLMGLKDIAEPLSSLDRSASDIIIPDGIDKLEQPRRPLLRATSTKC
ncbi:uncharacterized protein [Cicer arietinum]|uniref:Uncharacterized protein LOC101506051 isoform X2 n=1 Tax=Cicer arietinum TaxID=3827 RepID=A0A1S3DXR1_CICAR|nr:uncharacterized protein LOC101506051 isoform X2 [Cicer arietinum]